MTPSEHDELQKALRVLAERIVKTCREEIEKAHFDKTYTAKIVGIKFTINMLSNITENSLL